MSTVVQYPMNFYSRAVTNASGSSPSYLIFLNHADRATVSSGTWFIDQSTFDSQIFSRGSSVIQVASGAYFGVGGLLLDNSSTDSRIVWTVAGITVTTATPTKPAVQIECLAYLTSLNTAGMYWFDCRDDGSNTYARAYIYSHTAGGWRLAVDFFADALGVFFNHEYTLPTITTGSWMHLALVRVNTESPGGNRVGLFHNGSQLPAVAGGFPTSGSGDWRDCAFAFPQGNRFAWGGLVSTSGNNWIGYMDEMRVLYDGIEGLAYDTFLSVYYFQVPTAPYSPADGTYNITAKTLVLNSANLSPASDGLLSLGQSGTQWLDVWSKGTAYLNQIGQTFTVVGSYHVQFRDATTYLFSSAAGYITLAAGTQITLAADVAMSAVNFIFDSATGVKIGTATNQKLAFWGATPIVRPGATSDLKDSLVNLGLVTDGGATPLNLDAGKLTAGSGSFAASVAVAGAFYATGYHYKVTQIGTGTSSYQLTTGDDVVICASVNDTTVLLPEATQSGKVFFIKNVASAGTVTVSVGTYSAVSGIDGTPTYTLNSQEKAIFFDGKTVANPGAGYGDWSYRRLISVTTDTAYLLATQSNFPLTIRLTTANFTFANANSDGSDIRFADLGDTALDFKRLFYGYLIDTADLCTGGVATADTNGGNWATITSCFDDNTGTFGNSVDSVGEHWIYYDFGSATTHVVKMLRMMPYSNAWGATVKNFYFEGSNDTSGAWTLIYTGHHQSNARYESYIITNDTAYRFYRVRCPDAWTNPTHGLIGFYEIAMFAASTVPLGVFMVNVPTLSVGTQFYVYYGNATAADLSGSAAFDSDFAGLWPCHSVGSGSSPVINDVTSYGRDGYAYDALGRARPELTVNTMWGYALSFEGSHLFTIADDSVWDSGMVNFTWSFWVQHSNTTGNQCYIGRGNGVSYLYWAKEGTTIRFRDYNGGPDFNIAQSFTANSLTMVTVRRSSNLFHLYFNTTLVGTMTSALALLDRATALMVGFHTGINYAVVGSLWNIQISTVARGTDWIRVKYFADTDQLLTTGAEDTNFGGGAGALLYHWVTF